MLNTLLEKYNKLQSRLEKAEVYLDEPYRLKLKGAELNKAIAEREPFINMAHEIILEMNQLLNKIENLGGDINNISA